MEYYKLIADVLRVLANDIDNDNIAPEQLANLLNWMHTDILESIAKLQIAA